MNKVLVCMCLFSTEGVEDVTARVTPVKINVLSHDIREHKLIWGGVCVCKSDFFFSFFLRQICFDVLFLLVLLFFLNKM